MHTPCDTTFKFSAAGSPEDAHGPITRAVADAVSSYRSMPPIYSALKISIVANETRGFHRTCAIPPAMRIVGPSVLRALVHT